jgi:hypothetical protein
MSRSSRRYRRGKGRDRILGTLLAIIGVVALGGLFATVWWLRSTRAEIVESTLCPKAGPRAVHALIFDRTDPVTPQQALQVEQYVNDLISTASAGQRFDLYTVEGDTERLLAPVLEVCSPGQGKDANELYQNPAKIQERFEKKFSEVFKGVVKGLLQNSTRPSSPIIESMRAAAIESFGPFDQKAVPTELTVISDMVQHSSLDSHVRAIPSFAKLSKSQAWRSLQPDFRGAAVDILYVLRPTAQRGGTPIQNRGHQLFWEELVSASNGRLMKIRTI